MFTTTPTHGRGGRMNSVGTTTGVPSPGSQTDIPGLAREKTTKPKTKNQTKTSKEKRASAGTTCSRPTRLLPSVGSGNGALQTGAAHHASSRTSTCRQGTERTLAVVGEGGCTMHFMG